MPPDDVTLGELSRGIDRIAINVDGMWAELKEIRAGYVPRREFEAYQTQLVKDMQSVKDEGRMNLGSVAGAVKDLRDEIDKTLDRRWAFGLAVFTAVTAVAAAFVGVLVHA